jgi:signal transduction histidine kinase
VLPLLAFSLAAEVFEYRRDRELIAEQQLSSVRSFADSVGRELQSVQGALTRLATTLALRRLDDEGFLNEAAGLLAELPSGSTLTLLGADGSRLLELPTPPSPTVGTVARDDPPSVSDLVAATQDQPAGVELSVPARAAGWGPGQRLVLRLGLGKFQTITEQQRPQPGWNLWLTDSAGAILARWPRVEGALGTLTLDLPDLPPSGGQGIARVATREGTPALAAFAPVPGAGWHVGLAVAERQLTGPVQRRAEEALAAGGVMLLTGLLLARWVARNILRPIERLQIIAAAPDGADAPEPPATGLREADAVARALHVAATTRREALGRLQALTATLEQRVAEEVAAREAAQVAVMHAERMQALGQLASGIAHDFNNVLQTAETSGDLLRACPDKPETVLRVARLITEAARRGAAITGRLLAFSRPTALTGEPVEVASLLEALRELLATTLPPSIELHVAVAAGLPPVLAHRGQLETVVLNLATNARDAMPGGGELTLAAEAVVVAEAPDDAGRALGLAPGHYVRLVAQDSGAGMAPEVLARATEPFFTTKRVGQGTGLGLAMAHRFAEQFHGALQIASAPDQGTTVALWLPAAAEG